MKHKYHGISYELISNEFWVEAETYEEAKEKLDSYDAEFGAAEEADSFIQLYSIEVVKEWQYYVVINGNQSVGIWKYVY